MEDSKGGKTKYHIPANAIMSAPTGDKVTKGQLLITVDIDAVIAAEAEEEA